MMAVMLARIRVSIPDQPGTLGRIASAIGAAGGDVHEVQVLDSELGRATDDVWVRVSGSDHLHRLVRALTSIRGVTVDGVRAPVGEVSRLGELELISAVLETPDLQVMVNQAVASLDLTWAAVVDAASVGVATVHEPTVLASSAQGPAIGTAFGLPVRLAARETATDGALLVIPLAPTSGALVVSRAEGPTFHHREIFRFGELGRVLGQAVFHVARDLHYSA